MSQQIQTKFVILEPTAPGSVPNNSLFIDSSAGNQLATKTSSGQNQPIVGGSSGTNYFLKQMQVGSAFPAGAPLSKRPDGKVEVADSDSVNGRKYCAYALEAGVNVDDLVNVLCVGPNVPGALSGIVAVPGDIVFIGENGQYTVDPNSFTNNDDDIIQAGIADCAAGVASTTAVDLISLPQVLARA
jgi:hypothetical protein